MRRYEGGKYYDHERMISVTVRLPVSQVEFVKSFSKYSFSYNLRTIIVQFCAGMVRSERKTN